jgi:ribose transport system permease protein
MNILEGSAILLIVALGMTLVVSMGGIDLSVGIALDFGAAFAVVALKEYDAAWYVAILAGIVGGCLIGILNAVLIVWLNVSAFMATLGTFFIGSSVQRIFTNGGGPISHRRMPQEFRDLAVGRCRRHTYRSGHRRCGFNYLFHILRMLYLWKTNTSNRTSTDGRIDCWD